MAKREFKVIFEVPEKHKHVRTFSELLKISDRTGEVEVVEMKEVKRAKSREKTVDKGS